MLFVLEPPHACYDLGANLANGTDGSQPLEVQSLSSELEDPVILNIDEYAFNPTEGGNGVNESAQRPAC